MPVCVDLSVRRGASQSSIIRAGRLVCSIAARGILQAGCCAPAPAAVHEPPPPMVKRLHTCKVCALR